MQANKEYVQELIKKHNWSQNQFARNAGVSKTTASRWLRGERGAGRRLMSGIIKAFPNEPLEKLFFLEKPSPNRNKHVKEVE